MERRILPQGIKPDMEQTLNHILDSGLGNPIILSSAPTTAGGELKENQIGFDGTNLYLTIQGTTYRISLTAV